MDDHKLPAELEGTDISHLTRKAEKDALRDHIKDTADGIKLGMMELGRLLWGVKNGKYYTSWGYESFADYTQQELDIKERQAQYIILGYRKFKIELGASDSDLKGVSLSQIKELCRVADSKNFKKLLEDSRGKTVKETKAMVNKIADEDKKARGEEVTRNELMTFSFAEDQLANVHLALECAEDITGSKSKSHNLDMVCLEFLANSEKTKKLSLERHIKNIERTYGVKLIPVETEEMARDVLKTIKEKFE